MHKKAFAHIWETLEDKIENGELISSAEILTELKDEDLAKWAKAHKSAFIPLTQAVQLKTKEVLEAAKEFVAKVFETDHEGAENFAKAKAEELGIKLGDFMMPIRMAVTGSRVSPPLIGSISVLGKERSLKRIEKTLATL